MKNSKKGTNTDKNISLRFEKWGRKLSPYPVNCTVTDFSLSKKYLI